MRLLIISDIHANLTAFKAVMEDAADRWDKIWFLGDLIGYGPDPNECAALLQQLEPAVNLSGNHDWAVLGKLDISTFNREARTAITWTREALNENNRQYLESLPSNQVKGDFTLAHASPRQPVWEYILDGYTAAINFDHFDTPYCLVGHTHVPVIFEKVGENEIYIHAPLYNEPISLQDRRLIINPGSVGQPRDGDPRAAYAFLDTEEMTWEYRRVAYAVEETQARMESHNMPYKLVKRLEYGW